MFAWHLPINYIHQQKECKMSANVCAREQKCVVFAWRNEAFSFIFFSEKENEPKEIARVMRPCGLPCASQIGRTLWSSLTLRQPQRLIARFCDARRVTKGDQNQKRSLLLLFTVSFACSVKCFCLSI
jgi:hypothetical protein